jgi:hypothetical protein
MSKISSTSNADRILQAFRSARVKDSPASFKLSLSELQGIVRNARKGGLDEREKYALAAGWNGFPAGLSGATRRARDYFERIEKKYDLPELATPFKKSGP